MRKCVFLKFTNHVGIRGNEKSEFAVKSALDLPCFKVSVPNIDFKHSINQYILSTWQDDWISAVANKLYSELQGSVGGMK